MLPNDVKPISVDDHIIEPPDLWQTRLPERYRAAGPRVVELADGNEAWAFEDQVVQTLRGNTRTADGFDDDPMCRQTTTPVSSTARHSGSQCSV